MKKSISITLFLAFIVVTFIVYFFVKQHPEAQVNADSNTNLSLLDVNDMQKVNLGKKVYAQNCAACHGANLEGQPNWKQPGPDGRLPAPPHNESGHTWHHPDSYLIHVVKESLTPGVDKPIGYQNNMPAFGKILSDSEVIAVLTYIKSTWSIDYQEWQEETNKPVKKVTKS